MSRKLLANGHTTEYTTSTAVQAAKEIDDAYSKQFTIGWICPTLLEYKAAQAALTVDKVSCIRKSGDDNEYIEANIRHQRVVIGLQDDPGQVAAGRLAEAMSNSFKNIKDYMVVGMAGGIPSYKIPNGRQPIVLGDVVISSACPEKSGIVGIDAGSYHQGNFQIHNGRCSEPTKRVRDALNKLKNHAGCMARGPWKLHADKVNAVQSRIQELGADSPHGSLPLAADPGAELDYLICEDYKHSHDDRPCSDDRNKCIEHSTMRHQRGATGSTAREENTPFIHFGPVASSNSFCADSTRRKFLMEEGFYCVEMEAAAVASRYPTLTVRGIMDYCDAHRVHADEWRRYAAVTAAATAKYIISLMPPEQHNEEYPLEMPHPRNGTLPPPIRHHLAYMPGKCQLYRSQSTLDEVIETFFFSDSDTQDDARRRLLLYGLPGRGKTQACVAFMEMAKKISSRRCLWLNARGPKDLFKSLQNLQEDLDIPHKDPSPSSLTTPSQCPKSIGRDVNRWLSNEAQPWLMVLDNLEMVACGDFGLADMEEMLNSLFAAEHGRIIITCRYLPDWWYQSAKTAYNVKAMDPDSGLDLVLDHFPGEGNSDETKQAAKKLSSRLDYLPVGISVACATIKIRGGTIQSYLREWQSVFKEKQRHTNASNIHHETLETLLEETYTELKRQSGNSDQAHVVDLLKILACFDGSSISEAIFQRAWQLERLKRDKQANADPGSQKPRWYLLNYFRWRPQFLAGNPQDARPTFLIPDFLTPKPGEKVWEISAAKDKLRAALRKLEDFSFLEFSKERCDIRVSPIIQEWIRRHLYTSESLDAKTFYGSWCQASYILANSLVPHCAYFGQTQYSDASSTFQWQAAAHIDQLCHLRQQLYGISLPWTEDVLAIHERGEAASLFADVLAGYGRPELAGKLRTAYSQLVRADKNTLEGMVQRLTEADSEAQNGHYSKSLELRIATEADVPMLQIPNPNYGFSAPAPDQQRLLKLVIQRDISGDYWHLGHRAKSLQMITDVVENLEKFLQKVDAEDDDDYQREYINDIRTHITEAKIDMAERLACHGRKYVEAKAILAPVLASFRHAPRHDAPNEYNYLHVQSVNAQIMFASGQRSQARSERENILRQWKEKDEEMSNMATMEAQVAFANSLSVPEEVEKSLKLRMEVDFQLSQPNSRVPAGHDFVNESRQRLAMCWMQYANKHRSDHILRQDTVSKAVELVRWVWNNRRNSEHLGPIHPETLNSLALLIQYEREALRINELFWRETMKGPEAFKVTEEEISKRFAGKAAEVKGAWFRVKLQICLVANPVRRLPKLQALSHDLEAENQETVMQEIRLEIRYEHAVARMEKLYSYQNMHERHKESGSQEYRDAAEELEEIWVKTSDLLGLKHHTSRKTLAAVARAYHAIGHGRYGDVMMIKCALLFELHGEDSDSAIRELGDLNRWRKSNNFSKIERSQLGVSDNIS